MKVKSDNEKLENERQRAKEAAILLALKNNMALMRRGFEVWGMKKNGSTILIVKGTSYEQLWEDALNALKRHQ